MSGNRSRNMKLSKEDILGIAESVSSIIEGKIDERFDKIDERFDQLQVMMETYAKKADVDKVKCNIRVNHYNNDKLEQYTRRENIRIHNWKFNKEEALDKQVVGLLNHLARMHDKKTRDDDDDNIEEDLDNSIEPFRTSDISACHPMKTKAGSTKKPQVIVRFVSRAKVVEVYKIKKNLKLSKPLKGVFITDDLTLLRVKLRELVKNSTGVTQVFTKDGNIHCTYKESHVVISSPDDLFAIDVDVDLGALGLKDLV